MLSFYLLILYVVLIAVRPTRRFAIALTPWLIFACSYDWMKWYPNYLVNPIDTQGVYDAEKHLFGITEGNVRMIPCEYFAIHHNSLADFMAGVFYLCWVPVPFGFALYLFFKGERRWCARFSWAFLFVNVIGFIGYYIHPAAPPWYVMEHGVDPILHTPANAAGLTRWDDLTGLRVFHALYSPKANSNVFAAIPSLHAAYMLITLLYAIMSRRRWYTIALFSIILTGIWWTAVYTAHHYIIDILLGILTTVVGVALFETILRICRRFHAPTV